MSHVPTCLRASNYYVLTCLGALHYYVAMCLQALNYYVPTWLRAYVSSFFTCLYILACQYKFFAAIYLRALNYFLSTSAHFSRDYVPSTTYSLLHLVLLFFSRLFDLLSHSKQSLLLLKLHTANYILWGFLVSQLVRAQRQ